MAYYSGNPLNRLSYLRSSSAFLTSALSDDKARFILLNHLNPLCHPPSPLDGSIKLCSVAWSDVQQYINQGDAGGLTFRYVDDKMGFNSEEDLQAKLNSVNQPALVFLGVDERSAPEHVKSLPLSKPTTESTLASHSPFGVPYFGLDVTGLDELRHTWAGNLGHEVRWHVPVGAFGARVQGESLISAFKYRRLVICRYASWNGSHSFRRGCVSRYVPVVSDYTPPGFFFLFGFKLTRNR